MILKIIEFFKKMSGYFITKEYLDKKINDLVKKIRKEK